MRFTHDNLLKLSLTAEMSRNVDETRRRTHVLLVPQPGSAGVPQHDALLQTVDAGVLGTVPDHLARSAAARKVDKRREKTRTRARIWWARSRPPFAVFASKLPQTQMEWAQLLEAQQRYHDAELQKWREIIKSSVVLLDQVKSSRSCCQRGARRRLAKPRLLSTSASSSDERLAVEPPAGDRIEGTQLRVRGKERLPLTRQQKAEGVLCNTGAEAEQHAGGRDTRRGGGTSGEGRGDSRLQARRTTGSDSTTGRGIGERREACSFFFT